MDILMIVQESVNNAIKHSGASRIDIKSDLTDTEWTLSINDCGKGFDSQQSAKRQYAYGLIGMQERARKNNYSLKMESALGIGTTVMLVIPVLQHEINSNDQ